MYTIALFGESQKGAFQTAYLCKNLEQLSMYLGEPPSNDSQGLPFAIQALMHERSVVFFRVKEEGFSFQDYLSGLNFLVKKKDIPLISAICLPGVGNSQILEATTPVCDLHKSFLILNQKDLYDYLTSKEK